VLRLVCCRGSVEDGWCIGSKSALWQRDSR
jgi:hypothetical protein